MGEWVKLVNYTRREYLEGGHYPWVKPAEWSFNVSACAVCTWYMLRHRTDDVRFFSDWQDEQEFHRIGREFTDVTDEVVAAMIEEGILADCGMSWQDEDDPAAYVRDIRPRRDYFWPPPDEWR